MILPNDYEYDGQITIFDLVPPDENKYVPALNARGGYCEYNANVICNRYGEGYRDAKPHPHYACTGCCRHCDAYQGRCAWECQVKR